MDKYYLKKYNHFADFIKESLNEIYTKINFNSYKIEEKYNRASIIYYLKINDNEYELRIRIDINKSILEIIEQAKIDLNELLINIYK
jgi:hypothetical protein|nr:MAG TPA: hypothetical protein [Caudoviricetes sp.]